MSAKRTTKQVNSIKKVVSGKSKKAAVKSKKKGKVATTKTKLKVTKEKAPKVISFKIAKPAIIVGKALPDKLSALLLLAKDCVNEAHKNRTAVCNTAIDRIKFFASVTDINHHFKTDPEKIHKLSLPMAGASLSGLIMLREYPTTCRFLYEYALAQHVNAGTFRNAKMPQIELVPDVTVGMVIDKDAHAKFESIELAFCGAIHDAIDLLPTAGGKSWKKESKYRQNLILNSITKTISDAYDVSRNLISSRDEILRHIDVICKELKSHDL